MARLSSFFGGIASRAKQGFQAFIERGKQNRFRRRQEAAQTLRERGEQQRTAYTRQDAQFTTTSAMAPTYIPTPDPEQEPTIQDAVFINEPSSSGGGGYAAAQEAELQRKIEARKNRENELLSAINVIVNQINVAREVRTPEFDRAAAKVRAEQEVNPFFQEELNDYLKVVGIERRRRKEDFATASKRLQQKEQVFFRKAERQDLLESIAQRRAERIRGLGFSGVGQRQRGMQDIGQLERREEFATGVEQAREDIGKQQERFQESTKLEEEMKRREIERRKQRGIEEIVTQERGLFEEEQAREREKRASEIRSREGELSDLQRQLFDVRNMDIG